MLLLFLSDEVELEDVRCQAVMFLIFPPEQSFSILNPERTSSSPTRLYSAAFSTIFTVDSSVIQ